MSTAQTHNHQSQTLKSMMHSITFYVLVHLIRLWLVTVRMGTVAEKLPGME